VTYGFDPDQPGVRRLLEMARQVSPEELERVELLTPVWLAGEDRPIHHCGDVVVLSADVARELIDQGFARAAE
jgi:hypothetical protein